MAANPVSFNKGLPLAAVARVRDSPSSAGSITVRSLAKKREPIDHRIDALVWLRRKARKKTAKPKRTAALKYALKYALNWTQLIEAREAAAKQSY